MAAPVKYRLATLFRLRERANEQAQRALAETLRVLRQAQETLEKMEKDLERMVAHREVKMREYAEKSMRGELNAQEATDAHVYFKRLKEIEAAHLSAIEEHKEVIRAREAEVKAARQSLAAAAQALKALETHRDTWNQAQRREEQVREENRMDETAQAMHRSKTK